MGSSRWIYPSVSSQGLPPPGLNIKPNTTQHLPLTTTAYGTPQPTPPPLLLPQNAPQARRHLSPAPGHRPPTPTPSPDVQSWAELRITSGGMELARYGFAPTPSWNTLCNVVFTPTAGDTAIEFAARSNTTWPSYLVDNLQIIPW